jgi:hypothetical protein
MHTRLSPLGGLVAGFLLALGIAATAVGYAGQVAATVTVTGPAGLQPCGTPITISARVQELGGALISGQPVTWSFAGGKLSGDRILTATSTTNASGVATTRVQFACSPHSVTIMALADDASGTVVLGVSGEGLPRTDTVASASFPAVALAALAVLIGSGMILRRFALARR